MRAVPKALLALCVFWSAVARALQPAPYLPDPQLTPGGVFDGVTREDICTPGYSKKVRAVAKPQRDQAYARYGIASPKPGEYQIDHLVPLALGGSNSINNLWPMPHAASPWNARHKDALERKLLKLVCSEKLDLHTAQRAIETNWTSAYQKYVGGTVPAARTAQPLLQPRVSEKPAANKKDVWVNTASGKYWRPGSHLYGKTKHGEFMPEDEAINRGYRPARGVGY